MVRLIGIVPLGIGLTVLGFAWSNEFGGGFDGIPIFFRLFFSFIALGFVIMGAGIVFGGRGLMPPQQLIDKALDLRQQLEAGMRARGMTPPGGQKQTPPQITSEGYVCPSCNAPIGKNADVSPHGDVKCTHCGRWFNIHG